jgi:hypothetical protein
MDDIDRTLKSEHHPVFKPNIPIFHHSIGYQTANITPSG